MKLFRHIFVFREFVLILLLFITIERIVSDKRLANYINPNYHIFVYMTLIILLICAAFAVAIASGRDVGEKTSGISKYPLFIILIILMNLPHDNTLFYEHIQDEREFTSQTDSTDKTGKININEISRLIHDGATLPEDISDKNSSKDGIFKIERDNFYSAAEDIFANTGKYLNMKLYISGFVYKSKKLKKDRYVIARLVMYCCAADAGITGLIFDAEKTGGVFKKDEWLELYGHIEMQNAGSSGKFEKVPVLVVDSYRKIPPESTPYVYPVN